MLTKCGLLGRSERYKIHRGGPGKVVMTARESLSVTKRVSWARAGKARRRSGEDGGHKNILSRKERFFKRNGHAGGRERTSRETEATGQNWRNNDEAAVT